MLIRPYDPTLKSIWDAFAVNARNGSFLFHRDYVEHSADRFQDCSLMFYDREELVGVMAANKTASRFQSHAGLTYGGLLVDDSATLSRVLDAFRTVQEYLCERGFTGMTYKPIPHIYHRYPTEEDLYALFTLGAQLVQRKATTVVQSDQGPRYSRLRQRVLRRAQASGLVVRQTNDFDTFFGILSALLASKFGATPVHSAAELRYLGERFPNNIRLYAAYHDDQMLAGIVAFENPLVLRTQYIASGDRGKECGAIDLIVHFLLAERRFRFLDFGTSLAPDGTTLNEGLLRNKESYGGRSVVYDTYELTL